MTGPNPYNAVTDYYSGTYGQQSGAPDVTKPFQPPAPSQPMSTGQNDIYGLDTYLQQHSVYHGYNPNGEQNFDLRRGNVQTSGSLRHNVFSHGHDQVAQYAMFAAADAQGFAALQNQMWVAGFYGGSRPNFGVWTTKDAEAFKTALTGYAGMTDAGATITWEDYLDSAYAFGKANGGYGSGGGGGGGRAPLTISYTDPTELHETLQNAAQNALGRNLDSKELDAFVQSFHSKEASAQRAAYSGSSSATNPEVTGESKDYVDTNHQTEEGQRLQATYLDALDQALGVK